MSFASPWYLLGLLGIAIPLAIHLIRRQRAVRVVLPTARFLKKASQKTVYFQKIQQWLLLALRTAMVGLLAFAFARPFISGAYPELTGAQPRSLVILLDTSMSMQYEGHFEAGQRAAIDVLRSLSSRDEAAVIGFADHTGPVQSLTTDHAALERFVRNLESPGFHPTNVAVALRSADQMLQSAQYGDKRIYLVSDFRRGVFAAGTGKWKLSPGVRLETVNVGKPQTVNLAFSDGHLIAEQNRYTVIGRIQNMGTEPLDRARVNLSVNGEQIEEQVVGLTEGTDTRVQFHFTQDRSGSHSSALTLEGDRYQADNTFYFSFRVEPPLRILSVSRRHADNRGPDDAYWFRSALDIKTESTFLVDRIDPERFDLQDLAPYAVVALLDVDRISAGQSRALASYVSGGGGLLLAPAESVSATDFNRDYRNLTPALLQEKVVYSDGATAPAITQLNTGHPLIRSLLAGQTTAFESARFHGYWSTDPFADSEVVMQYESGQPALISRRFGNGRVILFTSSLDPAWNNFPRQVSYLPLLHEAMRYLAGSRQSPMAYRIGNLVPVPVPPGAVARVIAPDGGETQLRPAVQDPVFFRNTDVPGIYESRSGNLADTFAVNTAGVESDLRPMNPDVIRTAVVPVEGRRLAANSDSAAPIKIDAPTFEQFWWWILAVVLGLGLLETFLANRTYR